MRKIFLLSTTALLSACGGGGGTQSAGNLPPPASPGQAGSGHSFADPKERKTYPAIGSTHSYNYETSEETGVQSAQLYQGNASTARNSAISITYDPRDAIFEVKISDSLAGVSQDLRFQDPAHRTDFGGAIEPQPGTPDLGTGQFAKAGMRYLQAGSSSGTPDTAGYKQDVSTFFYQIPGTTTKYVTFAGYLRNNLNIKPRTDPGTGVTSLIYEYDLDRGAFAYGERTPDAAVPKTGSGSYSGAMLATMVFNPALDTDPTAPTYFQWINGSANTTVDFGASSFKIDLTGVTLAPHFDSHTSRAFTIQPGAIFNASGSGQIDLVHAGGFLGQFQSASFTQPGGARHDVTIAGSSVNGAFHGPTAQEVGGGFRIVGGVPDERIDILGAFVGVKAP